MTSRVCLRPCARGALRVTYFLLHQGSLKQSKVIRVASLRGIWFNIAPRIYLLCQRSERMESYPFSSDFPQTLAFRVSELWVKAWYWVASLTHLTPSMEWADCPCRSDRGSRSCGMSGIRQFSTDVRLAGTLPVSRGLRQIMLLTLCIAQLLAPPLAFINAITTVWHHWRYPGPETYWDDRSHPVDRSARLGVSKSVAEITIHVGGNI